MGDSPADRQSSADGTNSPNAALDIAEAEEEENETVFSKPTGMSRHNYKAEMHYHESGKGHQVTQKFFLQGWRRENNEQMQIIQHTEGWNILFQRSNPVMYHFNGLLMDGPGEFSWNDDFIKLYETQLKGSVAAYKNYKVDLHFGNRHVAGYFYNFGLSMSAAFDTASSFSLSMITTTDGVRKVRSA